MIQDIEPHHLDNQYKPVPPDKDSIALYYEDHAALMKVSEKGISFPSFADLEHLNREIYKECIYLFSVDDERYYLVNEIDRYFQNGRSARPGICRNYGISAL